MAVLIEGISVVIRAESLIAKYSGGWDKFKGDVPNQTMCSDNELIRVGFMTPHDVQTYVGRLEAEGLQYLSAGVPLDIIVVDQHQGPTVPCDWVEFGFIHLDAENSQRVAACRLKGSDQDILMRPEQWTFEKSLSYTSTYLSENFVSARLEFFRHEDGIDVYRDRQSGKEIYCGRSAGKQTGHPIRDAKSQIDRLLEGFAASGKSSPAGRHWHHFFEFLSTRGLDERTHPPVPLILAASGESASSKHDRLRRQLEWALANGCLGEAIEYLEQLHAEDWDTSSPDEWNRTSYWSDED